MAELNMLSLKKLLREGAVSGTFFVYGSEAFLKRRACELIGEQCMPDEFPEFNYEKLDGQRCGVDAVITALGQFPQFTDKRYVIVDDFSFSGVSDDDINYICEYIEKPTEGCTTVFRYMAEGSHNDGGFRKVCECCKKFGYTMKLETPDRNGLCDILCEEAEITGARLKPSDALYLVDRCGNNLSALVGELSKLAAFAGRKNITREMIDTLCSASLESKVFNISKAILRGRADEAFRLTENLLLQRTAPNEIISIMSGEFVDLYRAKAAKAAGESSAQVAKTFEANYKGKGFRVDNAFRDCGNYSQALLAKYIRLINRTAVDLNSSKTDKNIRLEQLISELCLAGRELR